ncbi:putative Zn-dependent protease [Altererythrobacter atlanticus]|uniref:TPR repeat-containing protein YfgC n=1 Tax=Croceibacterium atlanticum TaxID=1267766 RepID=A0A0F7KQE4_9SPHN|nr:M48 family metalloprotease [Croceibacterium atlanticum]AKH41774.1 TPR repeat-containing protein YfgC precursor [Croceibacterium atlanticum]MBB5733239.1 putative Zn-dependent protease [Croceibacterium atlanticum]
MSAVRFRKIRAIALSCVAAGSLAACTTVAGAGVAPGTPITQAEAQQGAQYHDEFVAEFGGEVSGPQASYVRDVGQGIAVQSGLATTPDAFTVTLLNSSVNNAFAVPGGYVYVTRQLVTLMNNEAELAGVLGHEVGHVAARHSARRQQTAQRNQILGVLGQVLSGVLLGDSALGRLGQEISSTAPQLATLSYSRSQELEADKLGVQYLNSAGYDPRAMAGVLASLAAQNSLDASLDGRNATVPEWASTHPDPASRVQNALQLAGNGTGVTNRDTFLSRIDGLVYGDDPAQGIIEGSTFTHPELRLAFTAPDGFYMMNGTRAVSINGDTGKAQMSGGSFSGSLDAYIRQAFQALGGEGSTLAPQNIERTTINGLPAAYGEARVTSNGSQVDVVVFAYQFPGNQVYHFTALAPAGGIGVFNPMFRSMRQITSSEAAQVVPRRLDVVTAGRGDTVRTLAARMAYPNAQEQRFRVLNGLSSSDQIIPGRQYKIVIRSK